jgi:hypothetical protein
VQDEHVGGLLDRVDDVVQLGGEGVDVFTVEGGDEGGVEAGQDGVGDAVAFVLVLDQPFGFQLRVDEGGCCVRRGAVRAMRLRA